MWSCSALLVVVTKTVLLVVVLGLFFCVDGDSRHNNRVCASANDSIRNSRNHSTRKSHLNYHNNLSIMTYRVTQLCVFVLIIIIPIMFCIVVVTILMTLAVILFDKQDQNVFLLCYGGG